MITTTPRNINWDKPQDLDLKHKEKVRKKLRKLVCLGSVICIYILIMIYVVYELTIKLGGTSDACPEGCLKWHNGCDTCTCPESFGQAMKCARAQPVCPDEESQSAPFCLKWSDPKFRDAYFEQYYESGTT